MCSSSAAAMAGDLEGVARVYEHVEPLMRFARAEQVEEELEASVGLLDACAAARVVHVHRREGVQEEDAGGVRGRREHHRHNRPAVAGSAQRFDGVAGAEGAQSAGRHDPAAGGGAGAALQAPGAMQGIPARHVQLIGGRSSERASTHQLSMHSGWWCLFKF